MKNKKKSRLMLNLVSISMFLKCFSLSVCAISQVISPRSECSNFGSVLKNNSSDDELKCNLKDNFIEGVMHSWQSTIASDEKVFFIAKDGLKKTELSKQIIFYRNQRVATQPFETPYYCDEIYFYVYKQKDTEPDFTVKEENFLGSYKTNSTNNLVYRRGNEIALTEKEDIYGNEIQGFFFSQLTPNYYSIRIPDLLFEIAIGKVILPQGQENIIPEEKQIGKAKYYMPGKYPGSAIWPNAVTKADSYFNFYVPEDVKEFKFVVYYYNLDDSRIQFEYNIKLNK